VGLDVGWAQDALALMPAIAKEENGS